MPCYDTSNEEGEGRSDTASFLSHMDREIRQTEHELLPKNRDAKQREQYRGGFSRTALQETNDGLQQK